MRLKNLRRLGDVARAAAAAMETETATPTPAATINPALEPTTADSLKELDDFSDSDSEAEEETAETNAFKSFYEYGERENDCCCRCLNDHPTVPPTFETRGHAFHKCPLVRALWEQLLQWLLQLHPKIQLSDDENQLFLGWPETRYVPPTAIHLHSVATNAIWRTSKLGNKENVLPNQLL
ncbi:hypothetical protein BGX28_006407 [Mortierella sp. GBA30]|nr:hypothetical protein BGX28_006407 [Mortierella sp. GBA30]